MKLVTIGSTITVGLLVCLTASGIGQSLLSKPKNTSVMIKPVSTGGLAKKEMLGKAANLSYSAYMKMTLFTQAKLTPRNPATETAGLFLERPAEYDPLRDLASFYSNQGNPAVRFNATLTDRPYLVDFTINNRTGSPAEFEMSFGPANSETGVGEGFVAETKQTVTIAPGVQHASMVVYAKKASWHWVALIAKKAPGLWNLQLGEITYLKPGGPNGQRE